MATALQVFFTGFSTSLALILAIGVQNAWVIRQGIRREHIVTVILVCILCDTSLIAFGTAAIDWINELLPWLLPVLKWGGVAYLLWFAFQSARSALTSSAALDDADESSGLSRRNVLLTTLAISLLNPHVYLDTVLMIGTVNNSFGDSRWVAAAGAMTASVLWFSGLGLGARVLAPYLNRPIVWRILDGIIALIMLGVAITLALSKVG